MRRISVGLLWVKGVINVRLTLLQVGVSLTPISWSLGALSIMCETALSILCLESTLESCMSLSEETPIWSNCNVNCFLEVIARGSNARWLGTFSKDFSFPALMQCNKIETFQENKIMMSAGTFGPQKHTTTNIRMIHYSSESGVGVKTCIVSHIRVQVQGCCCAHCFFK